MTDEHRLHLTAFGVGMQRPCQQRFWFARASCSSALRLSQAVGRLKMDAKTLPTIAFIGKIVNTIKERMGIHMPQFISGEYRGLHYKIIPKPWWRHALSLIKIYPPYMVGTPIFFQIKIVKREVDWHLSQLPVFVDFPGAKEQIPVNSLRSLPGDANKGTISEYDADGNFDMVFWIDVPHSVGAKRIVSVRGHHNDAIYYMVYGAILSCIIGNLLPSIIKYLFMEK